MNALWAGMMLMAIIYGTFHGTIPAVTQAALDSAKEAVSLCITMLGILSFWMGLMQVAVVFGFRHSVFGSFDSDTGLKPSPHGYFAPV